jgi:hypothetical protein
MFGVSSNQVAAQLAVVTANKVPVVVSCESQDRPFAAASRKAQTAI